ncbi:MAG: DUF357 domain-containing protein [Thermoplasmata archaeon]|uniref:DUF357 domain-containing protein n=1 Tax=Candidatus Sysuiplasma superficiale TaxID=2823368 RepID=A0A8J7YLB6_9ARCH|nr:DUF357 domain-containing protein [Candidatus Sysuiplasma superficiale]MBX8644381.1 DUF357 domain-containing protein [Candidatus Sysuiplasma superficiale]MCL4346643.1 DUF357 domain-containing protein [Candidatus Thermoplasmatota archaeon]MCL5437102.1 DUF357 domain-containing protein [Candidatus Thermoplasmatota archaeon]
MRRNTVSDVKLREYTELTERALSKIRIAIPEEGSLRRIAEDFLRMARDYFRDSKHFADEGDIVNAFACLNYAYGWIDAGARMGLFDVGSDHRLFTLNE